MSGVVHRSLVDTPAFVVAEFVTKTIKDTLTDVKRKAPVEKVVQTPADVNASWRHTERSGS